MKYTFITGAASGLGKELAKLYFKDNNNLILVDQNELKLNDLKNELLAINPSLEIKIIVKDLSKEENYYEILDEIRNEDIFVNNLVNAAGFGDQKDFKDMDVQKQLNLNHVNLDALLFFTRVFLDDMLKNNEGHIINVSSIAGFMSGPYMSTYHASKAYVLLLGESIAYELRKTNVKLLTLCPGPFNSNFVKEAHNDFTFSKIKPYEAKDVALFAFNKSKKGKTLAITGFKNKFLVFITRFFSRKFIAKVSARTMKKDA